MSGELQEHWHKFGPAHPAPESVVYSQFQARKQSQYSTYAKYASTFSSPASRPAANDVAIPPEVNQGAQHSTTDSSPASAGLLVRASDGEDGCVQSALLSPVASAREEAKVPVRAVSSMLFGNPAAQMKGRIDPARIAQLFGAPVAVAAGRQREEPERGEKVPAQNVYRAKVRARMSVQAVLTATFGVAADKPKAISVDSEAQTAAEEEKEVQCGPEAGLTVWLGNIDTAVMSTVPSSAPAQISSPDKTVRTAALSVSMLPPMASFLVPDCYSSAAAADMQGALNDSHDEIEPGPEDSKNRSSGKKPRGIMEADMERELQSIMLNPKASELEKQLFSGVERRAAEENLISQSTSAGTVPRQDALRPEEGRERAQSEEPRNEYPDVVMLPGQMREEDLGSLSSDSEEADAEIQRMLKETPDSIPFARLMEIPTN